MSVQSGDPSAGPCGNGARRTEIGYADRYGTAALAWGADHSAATSLLVRLLLLAERDWLLPRPPDAAMLASKIVGKSGRCGLVRQVTPTARRAMMIRSFRIALAAITALTRPDGSSDGARLPRGRTCRVRAPNGQGDKPEARIAQIHQSLSYNGKPAAISPARSITHLGWQQESALARTRSNTCSRLDSSSA